MKVAIHGLVTGDHLVEAELFAGIYPTSFQTTGSGKLVPGASNLPTELFKPDPMVGDELGVLQAEARLMVYSDALICVGQQPHLLKYAAGYGIPVYQVEK